MHAIGAPAVIQIMIHQPDTPLPQTHAVGSAIRQIRRHAAYRGVALPQVLDGWCEQVLDRSAQWLVQAYRRDQWSLSEQLAAALVSGMPEVILITPQAFATDSDRIIHVMENLGAMVTRYGLGGTALAGAWSILRRHVPSWTSCVESASLDLSNVMAWWHPAVWRSLPASVQHCITRPVERDLAVPMLSPLRAWLAGYPVDRDQWFAFLSTCHEPWSWFVAGMVGHSRVELEQMPRLEERDRAILARRRVLFDIIAQRNGTEDVLPLVEYGMEMMAPLPPAPITAVIGKERWQRWVEAWVAQDRAVECPVLDARSHVLADSHSRWSSGAHGCRRATRAAHHDHAPRSLSVAAMHPALPRDDRPVLDAGR